MRRTRKVQTNQDVLKRNRQSKKTYHRIKKTRIAAFWVENTKKAKAGTHRYPNGVGEDQGPRDMRVCHVVGESVSANSLTAGEYLHALECK